MKERIKTVQINGLTIGEGRPKICAPVTGTSVEAIVAQLQDFSGRPLDLAEWRMDFFEGVRSLGAVREALEVIKESLSDRPLLCTFRTKREGGGTPFTNEEYLALNKAVIDSGLADLVDVELFMGEAVVRSLTDYAHANGVRVVISNHDFKATPPRKELVLRLRQMQELGADIAKIAVMPLNREDVLTLLAATGEMYENYARIPLIAMSMGELGRCSRLFGGEFGSAVTFGAAGRASAPGQMKLEELAGVLKILYGTETGDLAPINQEKSLDIRSNRHYN